MDAISQTIFSSAFSWMKMFEFRLKFHWSLFLKVQLTIFQHWFRKWLGAVQATSHYLNQWWLVYRRIYASSGLNELSLCYVCFRHVSVATLIGLLLVLKSSSISIHLPSKRIDTSSAHCCLMSYMVSLNSGISDSDNDMLPNGTKPLPGPMLTFYKEGLVVFASGQFHRKCSRYLSLICVENHTCEIFSHICLGPMS